MSDDTRMERLRETGDRVEALFEAALEWPPEERDARLEAQCGDDREVLGIVRLLLDADERAGGFLEPICPSISALVGEDESGFVGRRFGPWQITEKIGDGGSAQVFAAVREDERFQRTVALKLMRTGLRSRETVERFQRERHILAGLEHPSIARLFDGGMSDDGTPYLIMEHVDGQPIDRYCRDKGLGLKERLEIFLEICSAVEFAHRRLVVHRDLKPGNILVGRDGRPKLLDFGIAKLLDPDALGLEASETRSCMLMMTPTHSSPEQAQGHSVTTASDVYSLGVILYQLLTDELPYRIEAGAPITRIMAVVCEEEPIRPSRRRRKSGGTSPVPARRIEGDLDAIVERALRKEPERRYGSVAAFAEDIRRFLDGRPVRTRRASAAYRVGKFVKRNLMAVGAAAAVLVALIAFSVNEARDAKRLASALDSAEAAGHEAQAINSFLIDLFNISDPGTSLGKTITASEILDRGAERIRTEFENEPLVKARMMVVIGHVYRELGLYDRALPLLEEALEIRSAHLEEPHVDVAVTEDELASLYEQLGDFERAEDLFRSALGCLEELGAPERATTLNNLAKLHLNQARYDDAVRFFSESLSLLRGELGEDHPKVARVLNNLGAANRRMMRYEDAERHYRASLEIRRRVLPATHPDIGTSLNNLGTLSEVQGRYDEAETHFAAALEIWEAALGPDHTDVALALSNLATVRAKQGRRDGVIELLERALEIRESRLGADHVDTAYVLNNLALAHWHLGQYDDVGPLWERALQAWRSSLGPEHPNVATGLNNLGALNRKLERFADAERYYRESLAIRERVLPEGHVDIGHSYRNLSSVFRLQGRTADEEIYLRKCLAVWTDAEAVDDTLLAEVKQRLADLGNGS